MSVAVHCLVVLLRRCGQNTEPMRLLPFRRLSASILPVVGGSVRLLVRHLLCSVKGHSIHSCRADGGSPFRRSPVDDWIETDCLRCGKTLRAPYGLALPNLKLGPPQ